LALVAVVVAGFSGVARAQSVTPGQIQAQIAGGDVGTAIGELQTAVQVHPDSGVAWYLMAEAQDAAGHEGAARDALAKAEQLAPGLPFANQQDVAALQAHVEAHGGGGISAMVLVIGGLVVLFVLFRLFSRMFFGGRRTVPMGYGPAYDGRPQYPAGYGPSSGGGIGSSLLTGLAAGAGLAAGERIVDDMMGQDRVPDQGQGFDQDPPRDDGLQGDPGWDDSGGGGGFDPGNDW
jgi:hypothetical protein